MQLKVPETENVKVRINTYKTHSKFETRFVSSKRKCISTIEIKIIAESYLQERIQSQNEMRFEPNHV